MTVKDGEYYLGKDHAYFYQVKCQLNVCKIDMRYFVVWSPNEAACVEITRDRSFFEEYLPIVDAFVTKAIYQKLLGNILQGNHMYRKSRNSCLCLNHVLTILQLHPVILQLKFICICKRPDDGHIMICCDNENCSNGQWFHLEFIV